MTDQPLWDGSRKPSFRPTLQKTFLAKGDITKSSAESINLSFSANGLQYDTIWDSNGRIERKDSGSKITAESFQELDAKTYSASLPITMLAGDPARAVNFLNYVSHQYNGHNDLDGISLEIAVDLLSDEGIKLGSSDTLNAIFFLKNFYSHDEGGPAILRQVNDDTSSSQKLATEFISRNAILINRYVFEELKTSFTNGDSPNHLLHIIGFLTDLSSGAPILKKSLTENEQNIINNILNNMEVEDPAKSLDRIKSDFDRLYDFPVSTDAIDLQQVGGTFSITGVDDVLLTEQDFAQYDLSLEYNTLNADRQSEMVYLHYDWNDFRGKVTNNTINFSFSSNNLIIPAEEHEPFMVYVRAADGMELWSKEYKAGSAALRNIHIAVTRPGGNMVKPGDVTVANPKRLRGQILDMTGQKPVLTGAKVVIEAKGAGDTDWRIVGSALSDKDGYFSLPYPKGVYTAAQAVVSLMPDSPASIPVHADKGDSRTISDDFIYLLLKSVTALPADNHDEDDCDCHNTLKATRLPDHADLIHADEYTQDLGAGCINLSTPNRTLKEYNHYAVVRTSDPDVANYTLVKDISGAFTLTGEKKKIRRKSIDLNNPIRWQDAPDTNPGEPTDNSHSNLSFYQAVTISTGHILHYKSMFKADGYSLGELIYSLPLAPGQKKQIVVFDNQHNLQGSESQQLSVSERLAANITNDRDVVDQLSGSIGETLLGRSSAETGGVAAAAAVAGSGGAVSGAVGVAGGYAMAGSNASQESARNISQFFTEKLRNSVMQNADSYRQQNSSVVHTVREGQTYSASTEVVANHNHCHSLTMMYFEVLRHYAIYQELTGVEECVFVPLLMTNFTKDNIFKWRDVIAKNLLPLPSNTYLPSVDGQHPLAKSFDAVERIKADWKNCDFPTGRFDQDPMRDIRGTLQLRVNLPRPKTKYDRILSLPIVNKTVYHEEIDPEAIAKNIAMAPFTFGLSLFNKNTKTVAETIHVQAQLFDHFMTMDANFDSVPPARCIRVTNFQPVGLLPNVLDFFGLKQFSISGTDFFEDGPLDKQLWETYAYILGYTGANAVFDLLDYYFKGKLIAEWDSIFYNDIAPILYEKIVDTLTFTKGVTTDPNTHKRTTAGSGYTIGTTLTPLNRYTGGDVVMNLTVQGQTNLSRYDIGDKLYMVSTTLVDNLNGLATVILQSLNLNYSTDYFSGPFFNGYLGESILKGAEMYVPLTSAEKRDPKLEDQYIVGRLIEHLNSNLEYYNKVLWYNLDADRRYMLLDGFNVQVFNDFGVPIGLKSLSSVIKNELITVAGNSLVFPVSPGFKIGRSYLVEKTTTGETERVGLLEHYKPLTPPAPYRISVPTKGLFMEAVQGQCNACEKVQPNTSQDWNTFKPDEPTGITAITPPTPTVTDWKATFKDIATATAVMQTAPTAPTVGAGLEGLSAALTKSDTFKDVTGLTGNQQNAASTYKSNMEAATKMAEIAKGLATQEHNTDKSAQIMDKLKEAKDSGAISQEEYSTLLKKHLAKQIDGGDSEGDEKKAKASASKSAESKRVTDMIVGAVNEGKNLEITQDENGNAKSIKIEGKGKAVKEKPIVTLAVINGTLESQGSDEENDPAKVKTKDNWAVGMTLMMNWKEQKKMSVAERVKQLGTSFVKTYNEDKGYKDDGKSSLYNSIGLTDDKADDLSLNDLVKRVSGYGPVCITLKLEKGLYSPEAWIVTKVTGTDDEDEEHATITYINANDGKGYSVSIADFRKVVAEGQKKHKADGSYDVIAVRFATKITKATPVFENPTS